MQTLTLANQKGGVGKSTVSLHFAFDLVERGYSVLFIDLDTQGNSSRVLQPYDTGYAASSLFEDGGRVPTDETFALLSADAGLIDVDRGDYETIRHMHAQLAECSGDYDWCIIDTPPTIGLCLSAALIVSDYVVSPIELEQFAIDGIERMVNTIFAVQRDYNPSLRFVGMLPNRYDPRSARQRDTLAELTAEYADYVIPSPLRIRATVPEALADGGPVWNLRKTGARDAGRQFRAAFDVIYNRMGVTHG